MHTSSFSPCFPSLTMDPDSHDSTETISHQVYENSRWTICRPGALLAVVCRILSFSYTNNIQIFVICCRYSFMPACSSFVLQLSYCFKNTVHLQRYPSSLANSCLGTTLLVQHTILCLNMQFKMGSAILLLSLVLYLCLADSSWQSALKMVRFNDWTEMSKNVANMQRRALKDLQRAWKTITQDHFKTFWKQNIKKLWRAHKFKQHSSFWLNWQSNWGSRNLFASVSHNITSHNQGKCPSSLSFNSWSYILLTFCQTLIIFYFTPVHCICERSLNLNLPWRS